MRLVSFRHRGRESWGAVSGECLVDLGARLHIPTLRRALETGALAAAREVAAHAPPDLALAEVTFLIPVPDCEKILCIGVNYGNRNAEYRDGSDTPKWPSVFPRFARSFVGHGEALRRPPESAQLDYEGEIAIVIGRGGRRIPEAEADSHIAGLACLNEGTVRDWTKHGKFNVTQGKNFDRSGAMGPWMVTPDEIGPLDKLRVKTRVNGEVRQKDGVENMIFPFDYLIQYISTFTTLVPGDVIATGTPTGAGARFDPPKWLKPGDRVEVEVPGIGILANTVIDEPQ